MLLQFENQEPFASGVTPYAYRPATDEEKTPRIVIILQLGGIETTAFVDTGGVYAICSPEFTQLLNLDPRDGFPSRVRSSRWNYPGNLHRVPITFISESGEDLTIEVTAFFPDLQFSSEWPEDFPCILGLYGCLERLRFAVDPSNEMFYFGELAPN